MSNIAMPGQYSPYFKSHLGTFFYITLAIFILIGVTLYFAKQEGFLPINQTTLYLLIGTILLIGVFLSDRIAFVFDAQGALILYPSSVQSKSDMVTGDATDGKTGTQKGSGIHASYSLWIYDDESTSTQERFLMAREKYSNSDLYHVDKNGNKIRKPGMTQKIEKQPAISLSSGNNILYYMQDPTSGDPTVVMSHSSQYTVPKHSWTCVQIIQTQTDVSMYINDRLDSVHTFQSIENPDLISKGSIVLFPSMDGAGDFNGMLSRIYYWNRQISPTTQKTVYQIGPVQGNILYELLKSVLGIPHILVTSSFVS